MIRVRLPRHLLELAGITGEVLIEARPATTTGNTTDNTTDKTTGNTTDKTTGNTTDNTTGKTTTMSIKDLLDEVEARYPVLRGTIRLHGSLERRAYVRFFACQEDLSHQPSDAPLPDAVLCGKEPFIVLGAMSGG